MFLNNNYIKKNTLFLLVLFLIIVGSILFFIKGFESIKILLPVFFAVLIFGYIRDKTNNYISQEYLFDISLTIATGLFVSSLNYIFILDNYYNRCTVNTILLISIGWIIIILIYFLKKELLNDIYHALSELLMSLSLNGLVIGLFVASSENFEKFYELACNVVAGSLLLMGLAHIIFRFSINGNSN